MKGIFSVAAALPLLFSGALADTLICRTVLATTSTTLVPSATATSITGSPAVVTKTNQQTVVTSKGLPTTTTLYTQSVRTITAATSTGTATVTSIRYSASTVRSTITNTAVVTSTSTTTTTSTTLLPTPSGFSPIDSTLNNGALSKRELEDLSNEKRAAKKVKTVNFKIGVVASQYPAAVFCTQFKSNTATVTSTTNLPATTNTVTFFSTPVRITSVLRETVTERPVTVTTTTITSVSPIVTSTTFLITSTSTIRATATRVISGPTAAAVCADASNYFGPNFLNDGAPYYVANALNNGPNVGNTGRIVSLNNMNTQEACCNACQASDLCEGFLYRAGNAGCFLFSHSDSTCTAQSNRANLLLSASGNAPGTSGFVAGNGKCGYFYSANADGSEFPVDMPNQ